MSQFSSPEITPARPSSKFESEAPYKLQAILINRWMQNRRQVDPTLSVGDLEMEWTEKFSPAFRALYNSTQRPRLLEIFLRGMRDEDLDALQDELDAITAPRQ